MEIQLNPLTEVVVRWLPARSPAGAYIHDFMLAPDLRAWCEETFGHAGQVVVAGPHVLLRLPDHEGLAFRLRWR